jgi:hypothetical protein
VSSGNQGLICEETIPGPASVPWKNFFVMSYAAKTPTYIDLALSSDFTAHLIPRKVCVHFSFNFHLEMKASPPRIISAVSTCGSSGLTPGGNRPLRPIDTLRYVSTVAVSAPAAAPLLPT